MTRWRVLLADPAGARIAALSSWFAARKGIALSTPNGRPPQLGFLAENLSERTPGPPSPRRRPTGCPPFVAEDRVPPLPDPVPVQGLKRDGASLVWTSGVPTDGVRPRFRRPPCAF
jgi:hypothetical protein